MKRIVSFLIIIFLLYFCFSLAYSIINTEGANKRVIEAQNELNQLKNENSKLKEDYAKTQTDQFVEKQARESLGMAKPGEKVVIMPKVTPLEEKGTIVTGIVERANWEKWAKLFF